MHGSMAGCVDHEPQVRHRSSCHRFCGEQARQMPTSCELAVSAPVVCQGLRCMAASPASDFRALDCCWTLGDTGCLLQEFCGAKHSQLNPTRRLQTLHRQEILATTDRKSTRLNSSH